MKLICGLGNPGTEYRNTRHNVGFMVCDILGRRHGIALDKRKFNGRFGTGNLLGCQAALLKPALFMNRSGLSIAAAVRFFRLGGKDLVVIHDDLDLETGRIHIKSGGGTAGHKGLISIVEQIGDDFIRLRLGIGRPREERMDAADYVLSPFDREERKIMENSLDRAADAVEVLVDKGLVHAMNQFNARTQ